MIRFSRHRIAAASPRLPALLLVLLVALACAKTTAAQQTTTTLILNMRASSVYDVSKNGSALTSVYTSPKGVLRFSDVSMPGDLISVAEDSTANTQPPSPPLIESADETSPGCVEVFWLPHGDPAVVGFEVGIGSRSVAGGEAPSYDRVVDVGNVTSYGTCGLSTGRHFVAVRARNHLGIPSPYSAELAVDISATAVAISAFEAGADGGAVKLDWEIFSDEALRGYVVYRSERADPDRGVPVHDERFLPPAARSLVDRSIAPATWYRYTLVVVREDGGEAAWLSRTVRTRPARLELDQNAPNPFNPQTSISFVLPAATTVRLEVFDVEGRRVATLVDGKMPPGRHRVRWDGTDRNGRPVATGTYFYRLTAGKRYLSRKMLLLK